MRSDSMAAAIVVGRPVKDEVLSGIKNASAKTGVSFEFLVAEASRESGLNPQAKAKTTSASGLFQFTEQTWLEVIKKNGPDHGLADLAKRIRRDEDGFLVVADPKLRRQIMDLRKDPEMSATMAAEYAKSNEEKLEGALKRDVGATDIYLAHFLGPNGAARFLKAQETAPDKSAAKILPIAARHNMSVFYEGGRPLSVANLYSKVQDSIDGTMIRLATLQKTLPEEPALNPEPVQAVAQAQPAPKPAPKPAPEANRAFVQNAGESLRQATAEAAAQMLAQTPPSFAGMVGASMVGESQGSPFSTPKVSMPMPPPLGARPQPLLPSQANQENALDGLLRKMRVAWLG
jgi:hypothetical protein